MARNRQKVVLTVEVDSEESSYGDRITALVRDTLREAEGVVGVDVDYQNTGPIERVRTSPDADRDRLVSLAAWAAGEQAKADLGLPSEWDQRHWISERDGVAAGGHCGTACCIAGKVALEEGWVPLRVQMPDGTSYLDSSNLVKDGRKEPVETLAAAILGLDEEDASRLFDGNNSLDSVLQVVGELIGTRS